MKYTYPGEFLGYSEELVAGEGTLEDETGIYAPTIGSKNIDEQSRKVSIKPLKTVRRITRGDAVYGVIHDLYDTMALIEFSAIPKDNVYPASETKMAFLRISEITNGYVEKITDYLRIGDYVKAEVLEVKNLGTYLTMKGRGLGVIRATCSYCRTSMEFDDGKFVCPHCGSKENRKLPQ